MAELLDPTEIFYTAYEPKMSNRFIMYIEGIPAYLVKAASRPSIDQGEVILDHINVERKLKGKSRWQDLDPLVMEELGIVLKEASVAKGAINLYEMEEIISDLYQLEGGAGLADRLTGWWEMLQNDPGFMELGRDPTDKFGGRR